MGAHLGGNNDGDSAELRRRMKAAFEAQSAARPGVLAPRRAALGVSLTVRRCRLTLCNSR